MPIPLVQAGLAALLAAAAPAGSNPLVAPWTGPYGGVPPFDEVKVEQFNPALEAGMADQRTAIDRITADAAAPSLFTKFSQNVLADENDYVLFLENEKDLAGLPDSFRSATAAAAESRGKKGQWAVLNTPVEPSSWRRSSAPGRSTRASTPWNTWRAPSST